MTVTSDDFDDLFRRSAVGPLSGVVIADFGRVLAAPYCTMLLADLGATVLKVESLAGDETRSWMPPVVDGESTYYMSVNRNKHSIALDFRNPDDLEVAKSLAAKCDVLVENFKGCGCIGRSNFDRKILCDNARESVKFLIKNIEGLIGSGAPVIVSTTCVSH